jgi:hypothetical protein
MHTSEPGVHLVYLWCTSDVHPVCTAGGDEEGRYGQAGWLWGAWRAVAAVSLCLVAICAYPPADFGGIIALVTWSGPVQPFWCWQVNTKTFSPGLGATNRAV